MKKIIAVVLCLAVVFTLSVSAFAAQKSPTPDKKVDIIVRAAGVDGHQIDEEFEVNVEDNKIKVNAIESRGTFNGFTIYAVIDGKTVVVATVDKDYNIISGSLKDKELVIKANTDLIICANYDGKTTDPTLPSKDSGSPETGDNGSVFFAVAMLAAVGFVFSAKKVLAK